MPETSKRKPNNRQQPPHTTFASWLLQVQAHGRSGHGWALRFNSPWRWTSRNEVARDSHNEGRSFDVIRMA